MKRAILLLILASLPAWGAISYRCTQPRITFAGSHLVPYCAHRIMTGTAVEIAATSCTVGDEGFATDAAAGANKRYCTATNTWSATTAATASALAADPTACPGGQVVTDIAANGTLTCAAAATNALTQAAEFTAPNALVKAAAGSGRAVTETGCTVDAGDALTCPGGINSGDGTAAGEIRLPELVANGSNYIAILAPDAITNTLTLALPNADPAGQVLQCATPVAGVSTCTWTTATGALPKDITILGPSTGDTNLVQLKWPSAVTISRISCSVDAGTSVSINFDERAEATPNTAGTDVLSAALVCDTNTQTSCAAGCDVNTITNGSIAQRVPVNLQITATSGTVNAVRIHVEAQ